MTSLREGSNQTKSLIIMAIKLKCFRLHIKKHYKIISGFTLALNYFKNSFLLLLRLRQC